MNSGVVMIPELWPLVLRVPLAKLIAKGKNSFLGPRLLFVAPRAADTSVELQFFDGVEQGHRLVHVAALVGRDFSTTRPLVMESPTERTISRSPNSAARRSRNS